MLVIRHLLQVPDNATDVATRERDVRVKATVADYVRYWLPATATAPRFAWLKWHTNGAPTAALPCLRHRSKWRKNAQLNTVSNKALTRWRRWASVWHCACFCAASRWLPGVERHTSEGHTCGGAWWKVS